MSFRKNYADRTITFSCDECGETFEADTPDFRDALEDFKLHGGEVRMEDGEWVHLCKDCQ